MSVCNDLHSDEMLIALKGMVRAHGLEGTEQAEKDAAFERAFDAIQGVQQSSNPGQLASVDNPYTRDVRERDKAWDLFAIDWLGVTTAHLFGVCRLAFNECWKKGPSYAAEAALEVLR